MSADTTPTNISFVQRDSSGDNDWVNVLGSANPNKSIGFNGSGVVSALATPLLTAANTFTAQQFISATSSDLLRLSRTGGTLDGENQRLRFLGGSSGASTSGFILAHDSFTSSVYTAKNYLRFYDDGVSIDNGAADKVLDVNTTAKSVAVTGNVTARAYVGANVAIAGSAIDWATGTSFSKTLSANTTFTFANTVSGQAITVAVTNTASNYTVTWPTVKWPNDLVPAQSIGAKTDVYTFKNIGGVIYGSIDSTARSFGVQYVKTWAQLQAAMVVATAAGGGVIYIDGVIEIPPNNPGGDGNFGTGGLNIAAQNIVITGPSNGSSVLKLQTGVNYTGFVNFTININASNVLIENITIQGVKNSWNGVAGVPYGIHLARGFNNPGISDTIIRNVTFINCSAAVRLTGAGGSGINRNLSIVNNKVRACWAGFYLTWGLDQLLIDGNSVIGDGAIFDGEKYSGDAAIYVGKGISNARIVNNYCADHQRMGIEVFFPFSNLTNSVQGPHANSYGQNDVGFIVANNTIKNVGSMGISFTGARNSIVANNTITDCVFIGLELVGDDKNQNSQRPDRIVNVLCANNTIKNVKATPRRPRPDLLPTNDDYGYSAIPLNPTSVELSATNSFSNLVPLQTLVPYQTGSKSFEFVTSNSYAGFEAGTQVQLKRTDNYGITMIGTVTSNDGTTIVVNVTSLSHTASATTYGFVLCMYGVRTINVPSLPIEWAGNSSKAYGIFVNGLGKGTALWIQSSAASEKDRYYTAYVYSYVPNATTCEIFISASTNNLFLEKTTWVAFTRQACTGISVDQINGAKVVGNSIDIILDSNNPERFGCQILKSTDIIFENNLISRSGTRYLFLNASNHVVVRNNVLRSGDKLMVRDAVTNNITLLGEDVNYPESVLLNSSPAYPSGIYALFGSGGPGYDVAEPYNNCHYIVKDNTMVPVVGVNTLDTYVNNAAVFSDQFSRPETEFDIGGRTKLKHNNSTDGYDITVDVPSPVLDYSQKWNDAGALSPFVAYRFHADYGASPESSRIFDVAGGDETYLYLKKYGSATSNTLALGAKTFTISSPTLAKFLLATVPAGTFVRCTAGIYTSGVNFVEGRVTTEVPLGSSSFEMLVTNFGGTGGPYTSWTIQFDTSALFVDKLSKLNLRSDVVLDYHTGTKIGTAATQKLGFWNATPVAQPAAVADATNGTTTQDRLNDLLARLRSVGIIAS